ncbi:hypothetical protein TVAG_244260 [Trichomonas vaginalis G3]|uniref:Borealin N-terminal domain-containing protein n=1 Tax=Trichomonas vaginalis (strain ATCC PRA-98 / G3) TaxID=412133 RepID=A2ES13_TRIV3|nr:Nbl1 / Borealin N terminal family [Trichomonas vaginalis G3]EAY04525.1 hypothetical protein TVAG_244260 [Trichomonas vaginalis G3]KAI5508459.1 Nbl1 / Borealin N terminal family [Trichomonas vaginalis G3]|eukprot:XP_001316748.1 hypothetical protein [Trichomonas vaginalis G3]
MTDCDPAQLILEFDQETASRKEVILKNMETAINGMLNALELTLLSIPDSVRKMPMKRLVEEFGGDIQKAACAFIPKSPMKTPTKGQTTPKKPTKNALYQNASLSDLLNQKAQMAQKSSGRKTPTRGRLPPKLPASSARPKTPTREKPTPRKIAAKL